MARNWYVSTSGSVDEMRSAFNEVFFSRPAFKERFKLSKGAQLRSQQRWEPASATGAHLAAELVGGGLREAVASSKRGPGSGLGTVVAMSIGSENGRTVGQLWLANYNTFLGMNQQSDLIKAYAKLIGSKLSDRDLVVDVGKV